MKNINCTVAQSNETFSKVAKVALDKGLRVRGYLSCVCGCPYEGAVHPTAVAKVCCIFVLGCPQKPVGTIKGRSKPFYHHIYSRLSKSDYN
jgi:hydroxymethylglutaryl-CoA lyase